MNIVHFYRQYKGDAEQDGNSETENGETEAEEEFYGRRIVWATEENLLPLLQAESATIKVKNV